MNITQSIESLLSFRAAQNYSAETLKTMACNLKTFLAFLKENDIEDSEHITFKTLMDFQKFISSLELAIGSKNQKIFAARALLKHLNERGHNIRGASMLRPLRMPEPIPKTLDKPNIDNLFGVIDDKRDLLIVSILFWSGLRVSELHKLSTVDIDLDNRTLRVQGKGDRERLAVFPHHVKILISEYLQDVRINYYNSLESQALFLSRKGNRLSVRAIQGLLTKYGQKAKLTESISPHWLRRSLATYLIHQKQDLNLMVLAKYLGHQSLSTLKHYLKFEVSDIKALIDEVLDGKATK